jgi:hypothetical protein
MSRTTKCIHCDASICYYIARYDEFRTRRCFCDGAIEARRKRVAKAKALAKAKATVAGKKKKKSLKINYKALALVFETNVIG